MSLLKCVQDIDPDPADETIEYGTATTSPVLFQNMVPKCTGFTIEYVVTEISEGDSSSLEGQEFVVFGRTETTDHWVELGRFTYVEIGIATKQDITFNEINLGQVICVRNEKSSSNSSELSWTSRKLISDIKYID